MMTAPISEHAFSTVTQRDAWLDRQHPARRATDIPGLYWLPDGRTLAVYAFHVRVYAADR